VAADTTTDEELAAGWEASVSSGKGDADDVWNAETAPGGPNASDATQSIAQQAVGSERILNQDEIDSLLGFSLEEENGAKRGGIRALINSALVSYERLPMLEVVFDRLVRLMTTSLRNFTSDNVECRWMHPVDALRRLSQLDPAAGHPRRVQGQAARQFRPADGRFEPDLLDRRRSAGRPSRHRGHARRGPALHHDRARAGQRMVEVILHDARKAFDPLTAVDFELDRIETNPRFAAIAQPANAAILVKLRIDMEDRGGRCELLLPYATLEPIRKMLLQHFMGEKFGRDNIWEGHLATELWSAPTALRVVLDEFQAPLGKMMNLQVGDTLIMNATPDSKAQLMCGDIHLTHGQVGRIGQNVAMRVEAPITHAAKKRVMEAR
jgi:flagellar motor switch protein FliM